MKKVIIDGVEYRAVTPEVNEEKPERLEGWINPKKFILEDWSAIVKNETYTQKTRMIEIKENEIVLSEQDVRHKLEGYFYPSQINSIVDVLGFKKDGV